VVFQLVFSFSSLKGKVIFFESRKKVKANQEFEKYLKILNMKGFDHTGEKSIERNRQNKDQNMGEKIKEDEHRLKVDLDFPPEGLVAKREPGGFSVELPLLGFGAVSLILFLFGSPFALFGGFAFLIASGLMEILFGLKFDISGNLWVGIVLGLIFFTVGLAIVFLAVVASFGKARLIFNKNRVFRELDLWGFKFKSKVLQADKIEEVEVRSDSLSRASAKSGRLSLGSWKFERRGGAKIGGQCELYLRTDAGEIVFGRGSRKLHLEWTRKVLVQEIFPRAS